MKLLTNGSHYKIFNVEHIIRDNLIIKEPIPITDIDKLEKLYLVIKYTTEFLEDNEIDYCIESGTLLGSVRHDGIIPWDNDVDIMIFKDGYFKLKTLIDKYNNNHFSILHMTPGFKLFYENECYGELFVYDEDKDELYKMAYPYINHSNNPTFITSRIFFPHQKYKKESLFPTQKILFEDFYIRAPHDIIDVLNITYTGNLLECKYNSKLNHQHEAIKINSFEIVTFIERKICNKIFLFIYVFFCWLISKNMLLIF